jgi:L-Ala-D/L-Glu epimerase
MKIRKIQTTVVTVPFTRPEIWARGARPCVTNVILEVETDDGLVGLGECGGGQGTANAIEEFSRYLLGSDPFDLIEQLRQRLRWSPSPSAFAAIETALLDLQGKATGQPVYKLLGGAVHRQVPFMYYLLRDKIEVMSQEAAAAVAAGFDTVFIKVGVEIEEDMEAIQAVRDAIGPHCKLRIDPNESWTIGTAARLFRRLESCDIELVEDPVPHDDLAGWRKLRASTSIPIAAQENAHTITDILAVIREGTADIILIDPFRNGGYTGMKSASALAEAAGLPVYMHSGGSLGIATAAAVHTLSTISNNVLASQTYAQFMGGDVVKEDVNRFVNGCLSPFEQPGLGVTLDTEKLAYYHEVYVRGDVVDGSYRREDMSQEVSAGNLYYPKY